MYPWLHLGPYTVSTYSLLFLCAFIVGGIITYYEAKRQHRATEVILRVAIGALIGGVLGAKLSMFIFLGPTTFIKDLPYLWYSGQAWTGAFFCGYAAVLIVKRFNHIKYSTGDIFAPALPLAQAIGRLGNLLGGDPFGQPSNLPWAITQYGVRRQPSALYELILDLLLFAVDFTRADPHVALGLTLVQILYGFAIVGFGYQLWRSFHKSRQAKRSLEEQTADAA